MTRAEYRRVCREIADEMRRQVFRDPRDWVARRRKFDAISHFAFVQARLWRWTGEPRYADDAREFLRAVTDQRDSLREADFFTVYPFAMACRMLDADGKLDDESRRAAREFMTRRFRAREVGDHNRAFTRACGLALAAQLEPDCAAADSWRQYADDVWRLWTQLGDVTENAPNYNRIDSVYLFLLADLLGRGEEMRRPQVRGMYNRWREQLTPSGAIPAYGDSGQGQLEPNADWPLRHGWAEWVAGFERAAVCYGDGAFRDAAARLFRRGMRSEPLGRRYFHAQSLSALMEAGEWTDDTLASVPMPMRSQLQRRPDPWSESVLDKLVMRLPSADATPYLLMDLYSRGHHGHVNQHGGINWLEVQQVPMVMSLGYNNRGPEHTNALLVRPMDGGFPDPAPLAANRWHTASVPTSRLPRVAGDPRLRRLGEFALRVATRRGVTLWADNLRLSGPQGEQLLEGFENPAGWNHSPHVTGLAREGDFGLVWQFSSGSFMATNSAVTQRLSELTFDCHRFPELKLDWKLSDVDEAARPLILRCGEDFHVHIPQHQPRLLDARLAERDGDQHGWVRFTDWGQPGQRHERRLCMTREGVLVVLDSLFPAADGEMMPSVVGPVWHTCPRAAPRPVTGGYHVAGASVELLLLFHRSSGQELGVVSRDVWSLPSQHTVFAWQSVGGESARPVPVSFVSVLAPLTANASGDRAAIDRAAREASVMLLEQPVEGQGGGGHVDVRLKLPGRDALRVRLHPWGNFRVQR
ncbi:MAG: hypothetical protein KDB14_19215 [Planctomycetales bacterium]|nr:hypothetical protein [Planctomycetales bacterium]